MSKQESVSPLSLEQLGESYQVIGELGGRRDARVFLGRRTADGLDVFIVVANRPQGDEGNALNHLAADTNLLASLEHRNVLHIVEGRWIGTDAFAVVMERNGAPTLDELLSRRDEKFGFARIASILREANMALEWARSQKVVHRAITPETLYVEPGSDRVRVSFAISALGAGGVPGPEADGKTIAGLAHAMLTRSPAAPERAELPLAELRPGLSTSLIAQTNALLQPAAGADAPDVTEYIARIAMADALRSAEDHTEQAQNAIREQQRLHKEQIEKERSAHEQQLAAERNAHEQQVAEQAKRFAKEQELHQQQVADQAKKFAKEQETHQQQVADQAKKFGKEADEYERELAKQREALVKEHEALAKDRAAHAKDREALLQERAAHARDRVALLEERRAHERLTKEQQAQLEAEAATLESQAQLYTHTAEIEAVQRADEARAMAGASPVAVPTPPTRPTPPSRPRISAAPKRQVPPWRTRAWSKRPTWARSWNRKWNVPAAAAGLVLFLGLTALAIGRGNNPGLSARAGTILDSAGGSVFPSVVPMPTTPLDSVQLVADSIVYAQAAADSAEARRARRALRAAAAAADSAAREDSLSRSGFIQQPEGGVPVDSAKAAAVAPAPPRRDSVPKPDTLVKRDSTARP